MTTDDSIRQQIARVQADIQRQQAVIARLETEVGELEREVGDIRSRYERTVEPAQTRLDAMRAAVEELEHRRHLEKYGTIQPLDSWTPPADYVPVEEQFRRVWYSPAPETPPPPPSSAKPRESALPGDPETRLKRLYRGLARRFHPDLAGNEVDRTFRTRLMALINQAYENRDMAVLEAVAEQGEQVNLEAPLALLKLSQLRQTSAELDQRVAELEALRSELTHSPLMRLKAEEKLAKRRGRDLLRDMAAQMDDEYWKLAARLENLRRK